MYVTLSSVRSCTRFSETTRLCAYWNMCANKSDYGTRKFLLGVGGGTAQELREKENGLSRYGISCL